MLIKYNIIGLDCANCAAKLEKELQKIECVKNLNINFMSMKLTYEVDEKYLDKVYTEIIKITNNVEPDVKYTEINENDLHHLHQEHYEDACCHQNHCHHKHDHNKSEHIHSGNNHPLNKNNPSINKNKIMIIRIVMTLILLALSLFIYNINKYIGISLVILSYIIISYDIIYKALKRIIKGKILDENFLMMVASLGALFIGEFFESVAVILLYQIGEFLQDFAVEHSRKSIKSLVELKSEFARVKKGKDEVVVDPYKVKIGEIIIVRPGEKIPLDGVIVNGNSSLDTSIITGESKPLDIYKGDNVYSGTINLTSILEIKVLALYKDSNVMRMLELVENASSNKSKSEKFITKFAKWYTPIVVIIAMLITLVACFAFSEKFSDSLYIGLSFLVVSCPCALVISVPLAFFSGIGKASKKGILVKGGNYLETLSKVNKIIFDKTGTLTKGKFKVSKIESSINKDEFILYAASLEHNFNHPIAKSIKEYYNSSIYLEVSNVLDVPGYGVQGIINDKKIILGNKKFMNKEGIDIPLNNEIDTTIYMAIDNIYQGYIAISDVIKETADITINELKNMGIKENIILSGDNIDVVNKIAKDLGIDKAIGSLTPQEKLSFLENEINKNNKHQKIAFVGDGVNDAPGLSLVDVGISMGALGSDVAIEASDIVIMDDNPYKIVEAIKIANKTKNIVTQNIVFSLLIKIIVMVLATFNLIYMWLAILADVGVALIAILNSLRIFKSKI